MLSAYGRMWEEQMKAYRKASDTGACLAQFRPPSFLTETPDRKSVV